MIGKLSVTRNTAEIIEKKDFRNKKHSPTFNATFDKYLSFIFVADITDIIDVRSMLCPCAFQNWWRYVPRMVPLFSVAFSIFEIHAGIHSICVQQSSLLLLNILACISL